MSDLSEKLTNSFAPSGDAEMTKSELLTAIWQCEEAYQKAVDRTRDHRQFLSRGELIRVFDLVRRRAELRARGDARLPDAPR